MDVRCSENFALAMPGSCTPDSHGGLPAIDIRARSARAIAPDIVGALRTYPYFAVLRGLPPTDQRGPIEDIVSAIADLGSSPGTGGRERKLSFTRVRIDPEAAGRSDAVTRYSRTHLALPPHTDSAYSPRPHSLVAFQMVRSDPQGGRSTIVPVPDIVRSLDVATLTQLRKPAFAFGKDDLPIIWGPAGDETMRYYRAQIDTAMRARGAVESPVLLKIIDDLLATRANQCTFTLHDGETLFLNNHKALHGRTAFAADSDRLMYRFRAHADMLG